MKESIGNAFLFYIVIIFVTIFCLLFVGSAAYSKASKVKDSIIDIIEYNNGYNNYVKDEIDENLRVIGYRTMINKCRSINIPDNSTASGTRVVNPERTPNFDYCIYDISDGEVGHYYKVVTYMRIDLPFAIKLGIPVSGETMTFRNDR